MKQIDLGVTFVTDLRFPARGLRELAVWLALEAGKHVHLMEHRVIYCLHERCPFGGDR